MAKQMAPSLTPEAAAYRKEIARLERECQRLHLEAIRCHCCYPYSTPTVPNYLSLLYLITVLTKFATGENYRPPFPQWCYFFCGIFLTRDAIMGPIRLGDASRGQPDSAHCIRRHHLGVLRIHEGLLTVRGAYTWTS